MLPAILGLSGPALTDDERAFFRAADPAGFILFARNCVDRGQLRALTDSLRELAGRADLPILIDQEGGRVARLCPPEWPAFPAPAAFGRLYQKAPISAIEAARANALAMAAMLGDVGINVDCAPVLDLLYPETNPVIGDRSFGSEPMQVAALGRAMLDGLEEGGVLGVVKHIPGHGRARSDSHSELPVVAASGEELEADLAPFRTLNRAAMGMVAHIVYSAWDPELPASASPAVIETVIRARIGFDGLLMSDDLEMKALSGGLGDRASAAISAGCDLALYCSGRLDESEEIAAVLGPMSDRSLDRLSAAMVRVAGRASEQIGEALAAKRDALLALA